MDKLSDSLEKNFKFFQDKLKYCEDVEFRILNPQNDNGKQIVFIYCENIIDETLLYETLFEKIIKHYPHGNEDVDISILENVFPPTSIYFTDKIEEILTNLFFGFCIILFPNQNKAGVVCYSNKEFRQVGEPQSEMIIRGPREGFIEVIRTNIAMVRSRLPNSNLKVRYKKIGSESKTCTAIIYMENKAPKDTVQKILDRIDSIKLENTHDSGTVERFLEEHPFSLFPQIVTTERPDKLTSDVAEGRIAILLDGSPHALIVPSSFKMFLQASEDYYERFWLGITLRGFRFFALLTTLLLPSFYVGVTTFHLDMLPTELALILASQKEGTPFPAFFEAILMEVFFELLREAGIRSPMPVGSAVAIVGGLIIGEAAIQAGIASPAMVIVVALTGIASFAIPKYSFAISLRILRFGLIIITSFFGLFGLMVASLMIVVHVTSLNSFGVPYLDISFSSFKEVKNFVFPPQTKNKINIKESD
jgi:spore germination protein KA